MTAITDRPFVGDEDIQAVTQFLLQLYCLNGTLVNWNPRRWEGHIYHRSDADYAAYRQQMPDVIRIWEVNGGIVGVVNEDGPGNAFLQIHPDYRELETAMLAWAEAHLAEKNEQGAHTLITWAFDGDHQREIMLEAHGYTRTDAYETTRRRPMDQPIPEFVLPEGYTLRNPRQTEADQQGMANLLNAAFGRTFHSLEEYRNYQLSPLYRTELDIAIEAPDGTLVANAGFTVHERESFALIEPVCTHPDHQGLNLARIAIAEGLRRVQVMDIDYTFIDAWYSNPVANHVYESMGFGDPAPNYLWQRSW